MTYRMRMGISPDSADPGDVLEVETELGTLTFVRGFSGWMGFGGYLFDAVVFGNVQRPDVPGMVAWVGPLPEWGNIRERDMWTGITPPARPRKRWWR